MLKSSFPSPFPLDFRAMNLRMTAIVAAAMHKKLDIQMLGTLLSLICASMYSISASLRATLLVMKDFKKIVASTGGLTYEQQILYVLCVARYMYSTFHRLETWRMPQACQTALLTPAMGCADLACYYCRYLRLQKEMGPECGAGWTYLPLT